MLQSLQFSMMNCCPLMLPDPATSELSCPALQRIHGEQNRTWLPDDVLALQVLQHEILGVESRVTAEVGSGLLDGFATG
jgi:hypothetical protein